LSTFNARNLVTGRNIYTTITEAANAAGFDVTVDGSPGHQSIAIRTGQTILEADLPRRLQAIGWQRVPVNIVNNLESMERISQWSARQYVQ